MDLTIKVLIISSDAKSFFSIKNSLAEMLLPLRLKGDFTHAEEYNDVRNALLQEEPFDIITLDGLLVDWPTIPLLNYFGRMQSAISIFIAPTIDLMREALAEDGASLYFFYDPANHGISTPDLNKIRQALFEAGKISFQIEEDKLGNPACIFSQKMVDSVQQNLEKIFKLLNKWRIRYSLDISDQSEQCEVYVNFEQIAVAKRVAENSKLDFWANWTRTYLN